MVDLLIFILLWPLGFILFVGLEKFFIAILGPEIGIIVSSVFWLILFACVITCCNE